MVVVTMCRSVGGWIGKHRYLLLAIYGAALLGHTKVLLAPHSNALIPGQCALHPCTIPQPAPRPWQCHPHTSPPAAALPTHHQALPGLAGREAGHELHSSPSVQGAVQCVDHAVHVVQRQ